MPKSEIERLIDQIYLFIVKTKGFLHVVENNKLFNNLTKRLSDLLNELNFLYEQLLENENDKKRIEILSVAANVLEQMHDIFMNFHPNDKLIINEKADLQIETSFIKKDILKLLEKSQLKK